VTVQNHILCIETDGFFYCEMNFKQKFAVT